MLVYLKQLSVDYIDKKLCIWLESTGSNSLLA